jgi:hypothetical protein
MRLHDAVPARLSRAPRRMLTHSCNRLCERLRIIGLENRHLGGPKNVLRGDTNPVDDLQRRLGRPSKANDVDGMALLDCGVRVPLGARLADWIMGRDDHADVQASRHPLRLRLLLGESRFNVTSNANRLTHSIHARRTRKPGTQP